MPLGSEVVRQESDRERAFLVGIDVRTRGRSGAKGTVPAQAAVAREAAAMQPATTGAALGAASKSNGKPRIPEFDADESIAELRTLAESAGAEVVGEILQRRDRPDPAPTALSGCDTWATCVAANRPITMVEIACLKMSCS